VIRLLKCVLLLALVTAPSAGVAQPSNHGADDGQILSGLLVPSCQPGRSGFAYLESATPAAMLESLSQSAAKNVLSPYQEALRDLMQRNTSPQPLPSGLGCGGVRIASRSAIDQAIAKGWEGTRLTLSLPGYNASGDRAVVYKGMQCGNGLRCGSGYFIELHKSNGSWVEENRIEAWFS
jgi:hypothetical protein